MCPCKQSSQGDPKSTNTSHDHPQQYRSMEGHYIHSTKIIAIESITLNDFTTSTSTVNSGIASQTIPMLFTNELSDATTTIYNHYLYQQCEPLDSL